MTHRSRTISRVTVALAVAGVIMFLPSAIFATYNGSITFTENIGAATYGGWTRYVDGLDVSAEVKGIGVGSTLWPDGGFACRTCTQQVRDVTCVRCFSSRWSRFWWKIENSTLLSWNNGAPRNDTSTQTKVCCGAPVPNLSEGAATLCTAEQTSPPGLAQPDSYTVVTLYMDLHNALRFDPSTLPLPADNNLTDYVNNVAQRYFVGAMKWAQGASAAQALSGEDPNAAQMASILFALSSEMNRIANNLAGPGVVPGDFFQTLQLTSSLKNLYMSDPSAVPTELASRTEEQVTILTQIDLLTSAGVDSFEVLDFIEVLERYNSWSFYNVGAAIQTKERQVSVEPPTPGLRPLVQVFPNPGRGVFHFRIRVDRPGEVVLDILDVSGRLIDRAISAKYTVAGPWESVWEVPQGLSPGAYIYRLSIGDVSESGKLTLLR